GSLAIMACAGLMRSSGRSRWPAKAMAGGRWWDRSWSMCGLRPTTRSDWSCLTSARAAVAWRCLWGMAEWIFALSDRLVGYSSVDHYGVCPAEVVAAVPGLGAAGLAAAPGWGAAARGPPLRQDS